MANDSTGGETGDAGAPQDGTGAALGGSGGGAPGQLRPTDVKRLNREWRRRTEGRLALLLDSVSQPFNVGSIGRTRAAFGPECGGARGGPGPERVLGVVGGAEPGGGREGGGRGGLPRGRRRTRLRRAAAGRG